MSHRTRSVLALVFAASLLMAGRGRAATSDPIRSVDDIPPAPATELRALNTGTDILLTWVPSVDDARTFTVFNGTYVPAGDVQGYRIYRTPQGGDAELVATTAPGVSEFTDAGVQTGLTYIYSVAAFDTDNETLPVIEPGSADDVARIVALGGGAPDIVVTRRVKARMTFDVAVDLADSAAVGAFKADFISLLASVLGIDPARITITTLEQGSTIVNFEIADVEGDTGPAADAALTDLVNRIDSGTEDGFASLGPVIGLTDESVDQVVVIPQPVDVNGNVVLSWFSRQGTQVGLADFFLFADRFGTAEGDATYEARFDIVPDGSVGLPDFFLFADQFGREIVNAADIQALINP